jgi:hypothetical protein
MWHERKPVKMYTGFSWGDLSGKRPLGTPQHRRNSNIKIDLQEVGWGSMEWIRLVQNRDRCQALVNAVINLWVP